MLESLDKAPIWGVQECCIILAVLGRSFPMCLGNTEKQNPMAESQMPPRLKHPAVLVLVWFSVGGKGLFVFHGKRYRV